METQHKVSWGRKRDTGRAQRFGLSTGKFDIAEIVKLPPTQVVRLRVGKMNVECADATGKFIAGVNADRRHGESRVATYESS